MEFAELPQASGTAWSSMQHAGHHLMLPTMQRGTAASPLPVRAWVLGVVWCWVAQPCLVRGVPELGEAMACVAASPCYSVMYIPPRQLVCEPPPVVGPSTPITQPWACRQCDQMLISPHLYNHRSKWRK